MARAMACYDMMLVCGPVGPTALRLFVHDSQTQIDLDLLLLCIL